MDEIDQRAQFALSQVLEAEEPEIPVASDEDIAELLFTPMEKALEADRKMERMPEYEDAILRDPHAAYYYASNVLHGAWPEAEPFIATSPAYSYFYALYARKERFPAGEPALLAARTGVYPSSYAKDVIHGQWPEYEQVLSTSDDAGDCYNYCREIGLPAPALEPIIAESMVYSYLYATNVLHARFPAGEVKIANDPEYWTKYKAAFGINEQLESVTTSDGIRVIAEPIDIFESFSGSLVSADESEAVVKNAAGVHFKVKLGQCTPLSEDNTLPDEPDPEVPALDDEGIAYLLSPFREFNDSWVGKALQAMTDDDYEDVHLDVHHRNTEKVRENPESFFVIHVKDSDNKEYTVYRSMEDAENAAVRSAIDSIRESPNNFNPDFIIRYVNLERLKSEMRDIASDVEDVRDGMSAEEAVEYLSDKDLLNKDDFYTEDGEFKDPDDYHGLQREIDRALDALGEKRYEDFDVLEWYKDVYGNTEYISKVLETASIDEHKAATDAVQQDGILQFLYNYDGEYVTLPGGAIVIRIN